MDKEMLDIVNDLSKRPTTELALQIMELSGENLILEQQCKKQKEVIDKINNFCKDDKNFEILDLYSQDIVDEIQTNLLDILKEGKNE